MTAKTALITGGNRGIGLETARQLGKLGYHVIIGCRDLQGGKKACETLVGEGIKVDHVALDVQSEDSVKAAAAVVGKMCNNTLDVLINNAGYCGARGTEIVDVVDMQKSFDINVVGTVRVTNHFLEMVKHAPAGRIVNLGSIMGSLNLHFVSIDSSPYNMSKAALNMYTLDLAQALEGTKVKVNSAHPGWVKTDMGGPDAELPIEEGAETSVFLATLPEDGPTGGFFHKKERLPW